MWCITCPGDGMHPVLGIDISSGQKNELQGLMNRCRRTEYRRTIAVWMRGDGESVECVAVKLHVTEKTVSVYGQQTISGMALMTYSRRTRERSLA